MVREIIHIQVGQCGNQIGTQLWTMMGMEHKLEQNGIFKGKPEINTNDQLRLDKIDVYYAEAGTMRFVPRACLVDLDPGVIDVIKASPMGRLFKPDNMCFGARGCYGSGAWAQGHYTEGAEIIDEAIDIIRRETEGCDCPQGFQLTHSIGSGTGGGMGTLILIKIRDNYPDRITSTFSVFPSPKVSDNVVEPYHATLSIHQLLENSDETFIFDNESLYNITHNIFKQKEPKYADLNWIICIAMSGITAPYRFISDNGLSCDMRKFGMNLIPFPRLHFFLVSVAPLFQRGQGIKANGHKSKDINDQLWSKNNWLCSTSDGKLLSSCLYFRGSKLREIDNDIFGYYNRYMDPRLILHPYSRNLNTYHEIPEEIIDLCCRYIPGDCPEYCQKYSKNVYEYEYEINKQCIKMNENLVNWIPNQMFSTMIDIPLFDNDKENCIDSSGILISNTTELKGVFQRISAQFAKMYKRKAFLHGHKGEGMDEMEFQEADRNVRDLLIEYQDKQDAWYDEPDDAWYIEPDTSDYTDDQEQDEDDDEEEDF